MTEQIRDVVIIEVGPYVPSPGGVTYHVTLESGAIITSPVGFARDDHRNDASTVVVADGRVFLIPGDVEKDTASIEYESLMRRVLEQSQ
jgi:uncharacterized membrane protein